MRLACHTAEAYMLCNVGPARAQTPYFHSCLTLPSLQLIRSEIIKTDKIKKMKFRMVNLLLVISKV